VLNSKLPPQPTAKQLSQSRAAASGKQSVAMTPKINSKKLIQGSQRFLPYIASS